MDLCSVVPSSTPTRLVNSQLHVVSGLQPVGILITFSVLLTVFVSLFSLPSTVLLHVNTMTLNSYEETSFNQAAGIFFDTYPSSPSAHVWCHLSCNLYFKYFVGTKCKQLIKSTLKKQKQKNESIFVQWVNIFTELAWGPYWKIQQARCKLAQRERDQYFVIRTEQASVVTQWIESSYSGKFLNT